MKKFLIAANHNVEKQLQDHFENEMGLPSDVFFMDSIGEKNNTNFYRHYSYFRVALRVFIHRNSYDSIIFWQQFIGLYYGFISRIFFFLPTQPKSIVLTLIYIKRNGFAGTLYHWFFSFMLYAKVLTKAVVHSEIELELYRRVFNVSEDKLAFAEVGEGEPDIFRPEFDKDFYFFSGGGSQRDYRTLLKLSHKRTFG